MLPLFHLFTCAQEVCLRRMEQNQSRNAEIKKWNDVFLRGSWHLWWNAQYHHVKNESAIVQNWRPSLFIKPHVCLFPALLSFSSTTALGFLFLPTRTFTHSHHSDAEQADPGCGSNIDLDGPAMAATGTVYRAESVYLDSAPQRPCVSDSTDVIACVCKTSTLGLIVLWYSSECVGEGVDVRRRYMRTTYRAKEKI